MTVSPSEPTRLPISLKEAHERLTAPGQPYEMAEALIGGRRQRVWRNAPASLREIFIASRVFEGREFLVYEDERITYRGFGAAVRALAAQLQADGVVKGDRVAIAMRNLPEWPVAFFAAVSLGAIATPLNAWWMGVELEYGLKDSEAKVAILDGERLERLEALLPGCEALQTVYVARAMGKRDSAVRDLLDVLGPTGSWEALQAPDLPQIQVQPDDPATLLYTSGTTGAPKGALGTHRNMCSNIMASGIAAARNLVRQGLEPPKADPLTAPQRVTLLAIPLFHATGCSANLCPLVNAGGKLVLMHRFDAGRALELIERERVTATGGVPTIAWQLVEHPDRERFDLSSLLQVTYGGAPSAPDLVRRLREVLPQALPGNGWGMTETTATFSSHLGAEYEARPDSCGPAAPVGDMRIVDPATLQDLPPGSVGELWVRGPQVVQSYWNKPAATAETFVDGWLRTGDLARLDEEGYCYIVDRAKDMLIRGGENIYCVEVENVLYDHPDVMDAALVGVPHRTLGEEPAAVVHLRPGGRATEDELRDFVRGRLAAFKTPVRIAFWPEPLPRNANGKILKGELRQVFEDGAGTR